MIALIHEDSILAAADGTNFIHVKDLNNTPLFTKKSITNSLCMGTMKCLSFKVTLSDDSSFISCSDKPEISTFYSYSKPFSGTKIRYINTTHDINKSQRFIIYNFYNKFNNEFVIPKDLNLHNIDNISNLQGCSREEYLKFHKENSKSSSGLCYVNNISKELYGVGYSYGTKNGSFCGLTNEELVKMCKEYHDKYPEIINIRFLLRRMQDEGIAVPKTFSKYRFGGNKTGYDTLNSIVFDGLGYVEDNPELKLDKMIEESIQKDKERKKLLKTLKLTVKSVEKLSESIFYKLKVDSPVAIITSIDDSNCNNCSGIYSN
jgi:hypothetical protein